MEPVSFAIMLWYEISTWQKYWTLQFWYFWWIILIYWPCQTFSRTYHENIFQMIFFQRDTSCPTYPRRSSEISSDLWRMLKVTWSTEMKEAGRSQWTWIILITTISLIHLMSTSNPRNPSSSLSPCHFLTRELGGAGIRRRERLDCEYYLVFTEILALPPPLSN